MDAEFNWLLHYKRSYEEYKGKAEKYKHYENKRDSMYTLYRDQIEIIRNAPDKYLSHINGAIAQNKVEYDGPPRIRYSYSAPSMPFDLTLHSIDRLDLYKIIKKHIFERRDTLLPEKTEAYIEAGGDRPGYKVTF
ncbi:hypothetical protein H8B06_17985 [Sphingobacterium sp. DN00404]|uniref:Uncharacterized protein n=1 Tax=Sphingobacterium micropteri TaxID=2763501 RepID=A0ABR7YU18_9SPHI|nr:hypothetical protein [Sphingobacterium micropteri]MBD1434721.1 hypothetical protein [Sphingobacterium micropteri]